MCKDVYLLCVPPVRDQFLLYELARSEKARHATLVCSELFVNICLCRQDECRSACSRVAVFGRNVPEFPCAAFFASPAIDRKSTRLNSSHLGISYAVFC